MVNAFVANPEKPDSTPVVPKVKVPLVVKVPVPDRVPFKVIEPPLLALGLAPSGKLQSLLTVLVPAVFVKVTKLNVLLPQARVTVVVPLKLIVPPLALKVAPELTVNVEPKEAVPDGALKVDPILTVKVPLKLAPPGAVTVPAF